MVAKPAKINGFPAELDRAAEMLKAVSHPVRLEILHILRVKRPVSVGEIQGRLQITQSMTSQHLAILRNIGLIGNTKDGNVRYYFLQNRNIFKLLDCVHRCCSSGRV